jgi:signal peptidase I
MKSFVAIVGMALITPIFAVSLVVTMRLFGETFYMAADTMQPAIQANDRVFAEKITTLLKRPYARGEIICFYAPPIETGGKDVSGDALHVMGKLTGCPLLPHDLTFVKRVVGLPGDRIRIVSGQGVFVNGKRLDESSYVKEAPMYSLNVLRDIGGYNITDHVTKPYADQHSNEPIVVPAGQLFVLGDNRNGSQDSHIFGMIKGDSVIGRVMMKFYPQLRIIDTP